MAAEARQFQDADRGREQSAGSSRSGPGAGAAPRRRGRGGRCAARGGGRGPAVRGADRARPAAAGQRHGQPSSVPRRLRQRSRACCCSCCWRLGGVPAAADERRGAVQLGLRRHVATLCSSDVGPSRDCPAAARRSGRPMPGEPQWPAAHGPAFRRAAGAREGLHDAARRARGPLRGGWRRRHGHGPCVLLGGRLATLRWHRLRADEQAGACCEGGDPEGEPGSRAGASGDRPHRRRRPAAAWADLRVHAAGLCIRCHVALPPQAGLVHGNVRAPPAKLSWPGLAAELAGAGRIRRQRRLCWQCRRIAARLSLASTAFRDDRHPGRRQR